MGFVDFSEFALCQNRVRGFKPRASNGFLPGPKACRFLLPPFSALFLSFAIWIPVLGSSWNKRHTVCVFQPFPFCKTVCVFDIYEAPWQWQSPWWRSLQPGQQWLGQRHTQKHRLKSHSFESLEACFQFFRPSNLICQTIARVARAARQHRNILKVCFPVKPVRFEWKLKWETQMCHMIYDKV